VAMRPRGVVCVKFSKMAGMLAVRIGAEPQLLKATIRTGRPQAAFSNALSASFLCSLKCSMLR
jgi:hypothetical protein